MPSKKVEVRAQWTEEDTTNLLRGMVHLLLSSRSQLYTIPELKRVADHGGNRISQKLQSLLKQLTKEHGAPEMVAEAIEQLKANRGANSGGTEKRKRDGKESGGSEKKPRVKKEQSAGDGSE